MKVQKQKNEINQTHLFCVIIQLLVIFKLSRHLPSIFLSVNSDRLSQIFLHPDVKMDMNVMTSGCVEKVGLC